MIICMNFCGLVFQSSKSQEWMFKIYLIFPTPELKQQKKVPSTSTSFWKYIHFRMFMLHVKHPPWKEFHAMYSIQNCKYKVSANI